MSIDEYDYEHSFNVWDDLAMKFFGHVQEIMAEHFHRNRVLYWHFKVWLVVSSIFWLGVFNVPEDYLGYLTKTVKYLLLAATTL